MTQANDAAERSAHVQRGPARGCTVSPVVEVSPGIWRLRVLVEAEAEIARLRHENGVLRQVREFWRNQCAAADDRAQAAEARCTCDGAGLGERGA